MSPTSLMTISRWSRNTVGIRRTECRRYNLRMFESMETNLNWAIGSMKSCLIGISRDVEMVRSHKQKSRSPNLVRSHRSGKHLWLRGRDQPPHPDNPLELIKRGALISSGKPLFAPGMEKCYVWKPLTKMETPSTLLCCGDSVIMCQCIGNQTATSKMCRLIRQAK